MARIGVSITMSTAFRNSTQEFSNVMYYEMGPLPDEAQANTIIDNIVTNMKTFHSTEVTFVRARLWSQTASTATSQMILQKNLSGTGARTASTDLDKERAFLFRLRAGVDSRGNPVYLRKWFHACGEFVTGQTIPAGVKKQSAGWAAPERAAQVAAMQGVSNGWSAGLGLQLISKNGRPPDAGESWQAHAFLEHHQFGDQWRAQ